MIKRTILLTISIIGVLSHQFKHQNSNLTPEDRAQALLKEMNLNEKFDMLHGSKGPYVGNTPQNTRLGIPSINLEDGPQGVADGVKKVTAFPGALNIAATFDQQLAYLFGQTMALEQKIKGTNVLLGPMMNIARIPFGGRNFESLGEDTYLAGEQAYAIIRGIQDQGIIACAKHFAMNNQEYNRSTVSENLGQQPMYDIYLPAFQRSVDAGVGSFMCSYNKINGTYACENEIMENILKKQMNFTGWMMSDWGATHSSDKAANAGLDQEMPGGYFFGDQLKQDLKDGKVTQEKIDNMVYRILLPMFQLGLFDRTNSGNLDADARSDENTQIARDLAAKSTVLLKNANRILPLYTPQIGKLAIIGSQGNKTVTVAGNGSGHVESDQVVSPLVAIQNYLSDSSITVSYSDNDLTAAQQLAQQSDVAIIFVSATSSEGSDRKTLALSDDQNKLIQTVTQFQKRKQTIVVVTCPGAVTMPWIDQIQGLIITFMPGQEFGNAITDILFGEVSPQAKLPVSFPVSDSQFWANSTEYYPGVDNNVMYGEYLHIGYNWYNMKKIKPLFYFGFGLTYTSFTFSNLNFRQTGTGLYDILMTFDAKNTGDRDGSETIQLYIDSNPGQDVMRKLKGFEKVELAKGKQRNVFFFLNEKSFQVWSYTEVKYVNPTGDFIFYISTASDDASAKLMLKCNIDKELKCGNAIDLQVQKYE